VVPLETSTVAAAITVYLCVVTLAIAAASRGALRIDPAAALRAD
jgi:hypothetical protein